MSIPNPPVQNPITKYLENVTPYHYYFFSIYFVTKFTSAWHTLNVIFLSPPMTYTCGDTAENASSSIMYNKCPCDDPIWDHSMFTRTVQTHFNIICDDKWLIRFSEIMTFSGLLVGAVMFGVLSDKYGRLTMFAACQFIMGVFGSIVAVMPTIFFYIIMRFYEGVGCGGGNVTGFVLCVENCGPKYRATVSSLMNLPTNLGLILMAAISYFITDYKQFQLVISIPMFIFVATKCLLLESPKWLLDNNKRKTIKVMEKFCRFNNQPYESVNVEINSYHGSRLNFTFGKKLKFYHIFKYRSHTRNFFCMAYCFFVCGMCYYGVLQFIGNMSPHVHMNTVYNGLFHSAGTVCSIFLINKLGRKPFLLATMSLAGIFILISELMPSNSQYDLRMICAGFSSSFFYMSYIIIYLYGVELFPTSIRNSAFGTLSLVAKIGQIIGPLIYSICTSAGSIFGCLAIVAAGLTCLLPETRGIELPSTLEEGRVHSIRVLNVGSSSSETNRRQPGATISDNSDSTTTTNEVNKVKQYKKKDIIKNKRGVI